MSQPAPNDPRILNSAGEAPDWNRWDARVRKMVIGPAPGDTADNKQKVLALPALPEDLAARFPELTHLYLWNLEGLVGLPGLPAGLKCLDLRGCADLSELPALPASLETLDLGGCAKLSRLPASLLPVLERFYFDGCAALKPHTLAVFLEGLQNSPVVEIEGSGVAAVTSLEEFPKSALRKLVLKDCPRLTDVSQLPTFPALEHLNLSGCTAVAALPDLPPRLRYLVLHGAENLQTFMGQDIGPYDRGKQGQDVARAFLSRKKFGIELAIMPHAKLLLMGDGRVGKTTLAKRFQWEELPPARRELPALAELRPTRGEKFTHKVCFWRWETGLSLPGKELGALEERAAAARLDLPKTTAGLLEGAVRIWDFGGQEIYHHTHRIFAGEGSIFLLVWREQEPDPDQAPEDVTPEEWREWNRQRPLDYWLDYIYSMRPNARVALVCTNCPDPDRMPRKPDWKARAPKHAYRELPSFCVDSLAQNCGQHQEYQRLARWIHEACGAEAQRIGILQPRFYREVSDLVDQWLAENSRARQTDDQPGHLLLPWPDWETNVRALHLNANHSGWPELDGDDMVAITDYLHQAGHLFQIQHKSQRAIIVDQEWAAGLIYELLLCGGPLRRTVKTHGGWFYRADLEADPLWRTLEDDLQRDRLVAYMEECRVVARIAEPDRQREGKEVFLATDKWLLPDYARLEERVDRLMQFIRETPGMAVRERFEFEELTLNEFDFRSLQAFLARTFGTRALYFRTGFQAQENDNAPGWCFRMRWLPDEQDPFVGRIDAVLVARERHLDWLAGEIEDLFFAEGSPIAHRRKPIARREARPEDLGHAFFRSLRHDEYDVGVSSSGADLHDAEALVAALRAAGLRVNWYRIPACRSEEREAVLSFMNSLGRQPCILLLISEAYLRNDPQDNWYCPWELADAIRQLSDGKRTTAQTLVLFKESSGFRFSQFNDSAHRLLKAMAAHFHKAFGALDPADAESFGYYNEWRQLFVDATRPERWSRFADARGTLGSAIGLDDLPRTAVGERDFSRVITAVERAL